MANYPITGTVTVAQATTISTSMTTIGTNYTYSVTGMTPATKRRLYGVGPKRTGFLDAMRAAASTYAAELGTLIDQGKYAANHDLYLQNRIIKNEMKVVYDNVVLVEEVALNNDFNFALSIYANLQTLGKTDPNIEAFINDEAQTHFAKAEHHLPHLTTIAPSSKITVNHCTPGKRGTNVGVTLLGFNEKGGSAATQINVLSGDTFLIPVGWVDIEVENKSTTVDGEFSLPGNH